MKKVSKKQKIELERRRKLKAELIGEFGRCCMKCGKSEDMWGLHLCHIIPLSRGGVTSRKNCYIGCLKCHGEQDHHLRIKL